MIGGKEGQIEVTTGPELSFGKGKTGHLVVCDKSLCLFSRLKLVMKIEKLSLQIILAPHDTVIID
jgi:hypothetical protein